MVSLPYSAMLSFAASLCQIGDTLQVTLLDVRLPQPLSDHTATAWGDTIYIAGGCDSPQGNQYIEGAGFFACNSVSNKLYSFNVTSQSFKVLADLPRPRYRHAAATVLGKLWLLGGRNVADQLVSTVDVYDIEKNVWSSLEDDLPLNYQLSDLAGFSFGRDFAYFLGGYDLSYNAQSTFFRINAELSVETGLLQLQNLPSMNLGRGDTPSVTVKPFASKLVVTGGYTHENSFCQALSSVEEFDFASDSWTMLPSLNNPRADHVVASDPMDSIYNIGGESTSIGFCENPQQQPGDWQQPVNMIERLSSDGKAWKELGDAPFHVYRTAGASIGNQVITFGGQRAFSASCQCYETSDAIIRYRFIDTDTSTSATSESPSEMPSAMHSLSPSTQEPSIIPSEVPTLVPVVAMSTAPTLSPRTMSPSAARNGEQTSSSSALRGRSALSLLALFIMAPMFG